MTTPVSLDETNDGWTVVVSLPGFAPEEVEVEIADRELRVRDKSADETAFTHRVELPGEADPDRVDVTMDHGLLTVRLPRRGIPVPGGTATV